ncbi:pentapeptide repeat-containing protein [Variovorax sp. RA8]|uniref:pentapeptide repeat-containing protein n=1 Tax=Variovorax sp. (strain JCM 16519 / RA8) TaxID=662548 RepID=UPI0013A59040|nr:pentapeptide repeat-containing protein [Variovorax sp. RA8]
MILADALSDALQRAHTTATAKASGYTAQITSLSTRDGNALVHVVLEDPEDLATFGGCATIRVQSQSSSSADTLCFAKLDLSGSDLRGADLQGVTLFQCSLQGASLEHADCTGTNFSDTSLFGTNLANARLNEA